MRNSTRPVFHAVLVLTGCAVTLCGSYTALLLVGDLRRHVVWFFGPYLAALAAYAAAVAVVRRAPLGWWGPVGILAAALVFRALMACSPPTLSDDIHRYVWDGRVAAAGINPYRHAPADPSLAFLRDATVYPAVTHKGIPTVYPPVQQWIFALVSRLGGGQTALKLFFLACDVGTMLLLMRLLGTMGLPSSHVLVYAWHPLIVIEFAGSGHHDAQGILLLVLAIVWLAQSRSILSAAMLGFAAGTKLFPLLLVPLLYRGRWSRAVPATLGVLAVAYLPFMAGGADVFAALREYADRWRFNDSAFWVVHESILRWANTREPLDAAKYAIAGIYTFLYVGIRHRQPLRMQWAPPCGARVVWVLGLFLILAPTLHPWYLTWLVPFLCVGFAFPWWLLTGLAPLSYAVLDDYVRSGTWQEPAWAWWAIYLPFYAALTHALITRRWWWPLRAAAGKSAGGAAPAEAPD